MRRNENENYDLVRKSITLNNFRTIKKKKFTSKDLADAIGVKKVTIDNFLSTTKNRKIPLVSNLVKLANVLDCTTDYLIDRTSSEEHVDILYEKYVNKNRSIELHLLVHDLDSMKEEYLDALISYWKFLQDNKKNKYVILKDEFKEKKIKNSDKLTMFNFKKIIEKLGYTSESISSSTKIPKGTIDSYLSTDTPSLTNLVILSDYLNCSIEFLLDRTIIPTREDNIINNNRSEKLKLFINELDEANDLDVMFISKFSQSLGIDRRK